MDFKYKIGDRVRVRSDLKMGVQYFMGTNHDGNDVTDVATEEMLTYAGKIVTIRSHWGDKKYEIEGCHYNWVDGMFDGIVIEGKPAKPVAGKLKAGDKVRVRPDLTAGEHYGDTYTASDMVRWAGKTVTIKSVSDPDGHRFRIKDDKGEWCWNLEMFTSDGEEDKRAADSPKQEITITADGKKTTAVFKNNGKTYTAISRCSPDDTFDFVEGAKIAFSRLWEDYEEEDTEKAYNGKVVCIQRGYGAGIPIDNFTVGKVYTVTDGIIAGDQYNGANKYYSLEALCLGMAYKFIPLVE